MTTQSYSERRRYLAERKQYLLKEGATFRAEIIACRHVIRTRMTDRSNTKNLFECIVEMAYSTMAKKPGLFSAFHLQSMAPILVTGFSLLSKRYVRKVLILGSVLIATLGTATYFSGKNNTARNGE